ncbi:hypothetical protein GLW08_08125 [Pontibacillus yanchengensis]|uniref:Uncharacterized protein n=1 Tax=Pontibacillus yanchengensis TaxID=462910 RepID=A0ACC7VH96_9BACI|nr:hypothetical protein [Pontibacillus yanchengensis]MYL53304.1 hypothetical protein [Pontibacillus yanchengensis]
MTVLNASKVEWISYDVKGEVERLLGENEVFKRKAKEAANDDDYVYYNERAAEIETEFFSM